MQKLGRNFSFNCRRKYSPFSLFVCFYDLRGGWSGGAKVLGKLPVPGRPTILITEGEMPYCAWCGWGLFGHFYSHLFSSLSPSLWEWITVEQGPTALAVGAGGGCLDISLSSILSPLSPFLWEMARYRLKYCFKGPLSPKQPTYQLFGRRPDID